MYIYSCLVIGVALDEIFQVRQDEEEIVRYNEVTGEPFRRIGKKVTPVLFGREIKDRLSLNPHDWVPGLTGLSVFVCGDHRLAYAEPGLGLAGLDLKRFIVGREFARASEYEPLDLKRYAMQYKATQDVFNALGHTRRVRPFLANVWQY